MSNSFSIVHLTLLCITKYLDNFKPIIHKVVGPAKCEVASQASCFVNTAFGKNKFVSTKSVPV